MIPRVSLVVPVYNEGEAARKHILRLVEQVNLSCEILVVYDDINDSTIPIIQDLSVSHPEVRGLLNSLGRGPATAIRSGIREAKSDVVVVTMADGCDDASQVDSLVRLVERGVVIACASRYVRGGRQIGGSALKSTLSRLAGLSLFWFARVGVHDATNSFKAYSREFLEAVGVESQRGFEIGIEMVAKARRLRLPVAEIPTIWLDRSVGDSNFKMGEWMGAYLRWYVHSFGRKRLTSSYGAKGHQK